MPAIDQVFRSLGSRFLRFALLSLAFGWVGPDAADSASDISVQCDQAAAAASRASGVPMDVLRAIGLTESGRNTGGTVRPWPWTVNMEGAGKWFDTKQDALAYVEAHYARGARSFDVGCFQINYRWHGRNFTSIEAMFDPATNAAYAAKLLKSHYGNSGDWSVAAGAYHSKTPTYSDRYRKRFDRILATLAPIPAGPPTTVPAPPPTSSPPRSRTYPLLTTRAGDMRAMGSLVPVRAAAGRPTLIALD